MARLRGAVRHSYIWVVVALIYLPLLVVVAVSFNEPSSRGDINVSSFTTATTENYLNMFNDDDFWSALSNTVVIALIVVPISVALAVATVLGMRRARPAYREGVLAVSTAQIVNPDVITAVSLAILFAATWVPLGLPKGFGTVILAHVSFCTPYAIVAIYPRAAKLQENWILASKDLGYTPMRTFWRITVPYLMPSILTGAAVAFAISFDDFIITRLVGGRVQTIATRMYAMSRGIKTWVSTFGALVVLSTIAVTGVAMWLAARKARARQRPKARVAA